MKKIAIIGSDSYIAGNFINTIRNNWNTILVSRKPDSKKEIIFQENLFELKENTFKNCNVVINFAAIVHQPKLKNIELYKKINTDLVISLAKKAKNMGVKHFIQMSTIAVYGKEKLITEKSTAKPINAYGISKLNADKQLLAMQSNCFSISIIRPPMVYGVFAPGNMQRLIDFSLKGFPMPLKKVKNKRDFIFVKNLVQAINIVIENNIYNIILPTDKQAVSTLEILEIIKKHSKKKIRIIKIPKLVLLFIKKSSPNIFEKIFGELQIECNLPKTIYNPQFSVEEGIATMLKTKKT